MFVSSRNARRLVARLELLTALILVGLLPLAWRGEASARQSSGHGGTATRAAMSMAAPTAKTTPTPTTAPVAKTTPTPAAKMTPTPTTDSITTATLTPPIAVPTMTPPSLVSLTMTPLPIVLPTVTSLPIVLPTVTTPALTPLVATATPIVAPTNTPLATTTPTASPTTTPTTLPTTTGLATSTITAALTVTTTITALPFPMTVTATTTAATTTFPRPTPTGLARRVPVPVRPVALPAITALPVATAYPTPGPGVRRKGPTYLVGAYYFSGWSHGQNDNLSPLLTQSPLRAFEPLIGWYDDSQAQVDRAIDQAAGAGIGFFAFDWYDLAHPRYATDLTLNNGLRYYLTSRHRHRLKFCIVFVDLPPFMPRARDWYSLERAWVRLFKQPGYVHVNGKPLFIVFSPEHMLNIFGSPKNVHLALDNLRLYARKSGLPGVTIAVGATITPHVNPFHVAELRTSGYDVTTGYNYHAVGGERYRTPVPYARLVQENEAMWNRVIATLSQPYIPVITMGWDQRFSVREQKTAIIYAGRTPGKFLCYAAAARRWIDTHPRRTVREHIVLLFAWNEIGEGSALIPNRTDGYAYGNVVRRIFGAPNQSPGPLPC